MPKLTIDGIEVEVEAGTSVLQAAEQLGIEIPRFCYHDKLSVPANCRMCLVDIEKAPKPMASCAMPCGEGMVVSTNSEKVKKARKGVLEMTLINHPLDCPICDQGGECDLQDQAVSYGFDRSRYKEEKRAVKNKDLGPLVKTVMTRCILCSRCVRFGQEIAGVNEIGILHRGEHAEIGTYLGQMISSELSGNLIDVCPVGALTNKPYAFSARPWELRKTESIDVLDALGSNIRIDTRGGTVMRILPRLNEDINETWISDKTRFAVDGLQNQRIDRPYIRRNSTLEPASWEEAFSFIKEKITGKRIGGIIGDLADCESILALKDFTDEIECRQDGANFDVEHSVGYKFNTRIAGIEDADAILLVGTNPRVEAAMLNARIHKTWFEKKINIAVIGEKLDLNYPYSYIGDSVEFLEKLAKGKGEFSDILSKAKNPMIILGAGALCREDGLAVQSIARDIAEKYNMVRDDWNGFNMLHTAASRMGALELGCTSEKSLEDILEMEVLYLLGADEIVPDEISKDSFVIYQGHHGSSVSARADVILPGAAYTEKNATYVNIEGRPQHTRQAIFPPKDAREDWKIIRALSEFMEKYVTYSDISEIRKRLADVNPIFKHIDEVQPSKWEEFAKSGKVNKIPFKLPIENFYMTDIITRSSAVMAKCTEAFSGQKDEKDSKAVANG